ncbi:tetratricopeptide repeat protein [Candidatus Sumerlaeota bacterium]|nr:tetratricopeptide repeat protein [Candidatus Sumerlaeota bacterium]
MARNNPSRRDSAPLENREQMPGAVWFVYLLTFVYLGLVIYAFTPYTHNLDEIKVSILHFGGPLLLLCYLIFAAQGRLRMFPLRLFIPLGIFFLVLLVSTLLAGKPYSWVGWQQMAFHISLLGAFFCGFGLMRVKRDIHRILFIWMFLGLGTTLFGLFHYAGGFKILIKVFVTKENHYAPMGILFQTFVSAQDDMFSTILNRQFYAGFLVMLLPLTVAYSIVEEKSHLWKYVGIATVFLMAICLYLAHSKASSGASLAVALAFILLYRFFARYKEIHIPHLGIWIAGVLAIGLTLGIFTSDVGPEKFKTIHRSVASRVIIWRGGWDMFLYGPGPENWYEIEGKPPLDFRSFLIGCGPGTFRLIFPRYRTPDYFLHDISNVTLYSHNRFLDLLAETGLLGFLSYMIFFAAFFIKGMKGLLRSGDGEMRVYNIAFMCSILGIFLSNIFSPNSRWVVVGTNLWAIWGMGFGAFALALEKKEESSGKARGSFFKLPTPTPAVANIFLGITVLLLPVSFLCLRYAVLYFKGAKYNNTGLTYSKMGETYAEEREKNLYILKDNPDKAPVLEKMRAMSDQAYKIAIDAFKKALSCNKTFITTYYKLAHAYNSIGEVEESLKTYEELQKYAPDYSEIHFNLGVVHTVLAQQKKRLLVNATGKSREHLGKEITRHDELSLKEFQIAARMANKEQIRLMYAKKLVMAQKYEDAKKTYEYLLTLSPDNLEYIQSLAVICDHLKDYEDSLKYYTKLFRADPTNDSISSRIEWYYQKLDKKEEFEKFLITAIEATPLDHAPRIRLIDLYLKKNDKENVRRQLTILTRLSDFSIRKTESAQYNQRQLYQLVQAARAVQLPEAERYFLEKCLQADAGSSIGKTCIQLLKNFPKDTKTPGAKQ